MDLGHTRIGFIGGPENVQASQDRMETYLNVLNENGLPTLPEWRSYAGFTQASGREAAQRMLSLPDHPTAIFAACINLFAIVALRWVRLPDTP